MSPSSVSTTCHLLPEMVDDAMGQLAQQDGDFRAAVAQAGAASQEPGWPVEPGSLSEAVYWYRRTAGLGEANGPEEVAASLSNLGYAWRAQGRWAEAETAFRECLQLRQQHGNRAGLGQAFFDLGSLYQAQERWTDAEPALAQALTIAREIGDRRGEANSLGNLGVVYATLGLTEKAIDCLQQAVAITRDIDDDVLEKRMQERLARIPHA